MSHIVYLHLFRTSKLTKTPYYVSYEPWHYGDTLLSLNVACQVYPEMTTCKTFMYFDPETKDVFQHRMFSMDQFPELSQIEKDKRFTFQYVVMYLLSVDLSLYKQPLHCIHSERCAICFEEDVSEPLYTCGHYVHAHCIARCAKYECPLCRKECRLPSLLYVHPDLRPRASVLFETIGKENSAKLAKMIRNKKPQTQDQYISKWLEQVI